MSESDLAESSGRTDCIPWPTKRGTSLYLCCICSNCSAVRGGSLFLPDTATLPFFDK